MKTRIKLFFLVLLTLPALAQTPQRVDWTGLFTQMPPLPGNAQAALTFSQQPNTYLPYADKLRSIIDAIQQPNPISQRKIQQGMAMDAQFKADGVDKMTDSQRLAYAKQKNLGGEGSSARIDFAQKMKDPAFQKQFQAMSPQEKMALMQQQGVMKAPQTNVPATGNPMQADMVAMMQDPAMREKWKNMSQAERQAFIEQQKKAKGYDASRRPSAPSSDTSGSFADMIDGPSPASSSPVVEAITASQNLQNALTALATSSQALADQQRQQTDQRQATMQRALVDAGKVQESEGMAEAKRQGKSGKFWVLTNPAADRQIRVNAGMEQQQADNTALSTANGQWVRQQTALRQAVASYQKAMTAIQYGESLYADDTQFQNLATLSGKQAAALAALQSIADSFNKLATAAASNQANLVSNSQPASSSRQLVQGDGG